MDKIRITINLKDGLATLARVFPKNRKQKMVAQIAFFKDANQFTITDLTVEDKYRNKGYGSILMYVLMGLAKAEAKVIVLFSLVDAIHFYIGCGFIPIHKFNFSGGIYEGNRLKIVNLNPDKTFDSQVGNGDLVWFPPNVQMVSIYL